MEWTAEPAPVAMPSTERPHRPSPRILPVATGVVALAGGVALLVYPLLAMTVAVVYGVWTVVARRRREAVESPALR